MDLLILAFLFLILIALILFLAYTLFAMGAMIYGPVFVPSSGKKLHIMVSLPKINRRSRVIDLGSGDGTILLAIAEKYRIPVEGVEINPILIRKSRRRIAAAKLSSLITVRRQSFWSVDLSQYDVVFLYGTTYIMKRLEKKLLAEMQPGSQLVSNYFQLPSLKPSKSIDQVHLYQF